MRRLMNKRPSPALVIACLALAVALGGTSYAAVAIIPAHSVGTLQLKNAAVGNLQLKNNAVNSVKVSNGSLLAGDFAPGQIPAGPAGAPGAAGAAGAPGAAGPAGAPAFKAWAVVNGDGTLVRNSGVSSVSHTSAGRYTVGFNTDISNCAWLATATNPGSGTLSGVEISTNKDTNTTVRVATAFLSTLATDEGFAIAVFC